MPVSPPSRIGSFSRRAVLAASGGSLVACAGGLATVAASERPASAAAPATLPLKKDFAPSEIESAAIPLPAPPDGRVGFAVVGLGRLALEQILPAFAVSRQARLTALVSGTADKLAEVGDHYGVPAASRYAYDRFDEIARNPAVQVVYIVLPNALHRVYTERAARAGKHVLCEKPMATSVVDAEAMVSACARASRLLMIAYRMQYEPYNRELLRIVRSGELGKLRTITAENCQVQGDPTQWRLNKALAGGGALPDIGIYCLNAARFLTGEEPVKVQASLYATPGDARFREVEEAVSFQLEFPGGVLMQGMTSYAAHNGKRLRLDFEQGWAELDPAFSYSGQALRIERKVSEKVTEVAQRKLEAKNQFALEIDHMAARVKDGRMPHTPGAEGVADQRLMETIYRAAASGAAMKIDNQGGRDATRGPAPEEV